MNARDVADLFVDAIGKVEFYWNLYAFALIAIMGWYIFANNAVPLQLDLILLLRGDESALPRTVIEFGPISYVFQSTCTVCVH